LCNFQKKETEFKNNQKMFGLFKSKKGLTRKEKTQKYLEKKDVKINYNLPHIESEEEVSIRTPKEIAQRVTILATTNMVAFNGMTGVEATEYLKKYNLWDFVTPDEKDFLKNPTDQKKNQETWKCEGIWTLMWSLKVVNDLGFPNELCSLRNISADEYPIGQGKNPNKFINRITESRTKSEILDANDLYYRMYWTCVDARINGHELNELNSGVVYERHYALNWLINYMEQEWDNVSTDT
jgi:hypothetical protein